MFNSLITVPIEVTSITSEKERRNLMFETRRRAETLKEEGFTIESVDETTGQILAFKYMGRGARRFKLSAESMFDPVIRKEKC